MKNKPPHCLFLSHPQNRNTGDYIHRVTAPGQALSLYINVAEIQTTHPEYLTRCVDADLLVIIMIADPVVSFIIKVRKERGLPTIYEISDDFCDFPKSLPGAGFYSQDQTQQIIFECAGKADLLQFSSHGLWMKYGSLNKKSIVFKNQIDVVPELIIKPVSRLLNPVIGWAGSIGHMEEAKNLSDWLSKWLASRKYQSRAPVVIRIMAAEEVATVFKSLACQIDFETPGTFDQYLNFLDQIDIGFAILGVSDFSKGRSDGKYLEYSSRGVVCLATNGGEYKYSIINRENGCFFNDYDSFSIELNFLLDNHARRIEISESAHHYVKSERNHKISAVDRFKCYEILLRAERVEFEILSPSSCFSFESIIDETENKLYEAITLHGENSLHVALGLYLEVIEKYKDFYLPWEKSALVAKALGMESDAKLYSKIAHDCINYQINIGSDGFCRS